MTFGDEAEPQPLRPLRAGPFTLFLENGDLRYVKVGEREVIRRIYTAVRDRHWVTVPGVISDLQVADHGDHFSITCLREHRLEEIHLQTRLRITGGVEGAIRWDFDAEAKTTFLRNRIGLCVLHPLRACAGERCRTLHLDGTQVDRRFPVRVAAEQPVAGFQDLAGLAHELEPGVWTELRFTGDVFEMEDQRNWIDASFKTFSTPLQLPRPVEIKAGTRIQQSVELRWVTGRDPFQLPSHALPTSGGKRATGVKRSTNPGRAGERLPPERGITNEATVRIQWEDALTHRLPEIGLDCASQVEPHAPWQLDRLGELSLSHLRVDVRLALEGWRERLLPAVRDAGALGLPLELAVHLPCGALPAGLVELRRELTRTRADVLRVLAFHEGHPTTTSRALAAVREEFGDLEVPVGAGTDFDLYQLQLQRPPDGADFLCWSMNPQVHTNDHRSIMETPEAAAQQVASLRQVFPGIPLVVSPITLKPRFNPASGGDSAARSGLPPPLVDRRQRTLFGAAWTLGMLAALAPGGVEGLTFFETTGGRGVMETAAGLPASANIASKPGEVFPVWHVFASFAGFRQTSAVVVSDPLKLAALMLADRTGRRRLVLANLSPEPVRVEFGRQARGFARTLDSAGVVPATRDPAAFWRQSGRQFSGTERLDAQALSFLDLT